eukprot:2379147-Rhodomonas_salina.1
MLIRRAAGMGGAGRTADVTARVDSGGVGAISVREDDGGRGARWSARRRERATGTGVVLMMGGASASRAMSGRRATVALRRQIQAVTVVSFWSYVEPMVVGPGRHAIVLVTFLAKTAPSVQRDGSVAVARLDVRLIALAPGAARAGRRGVATALTALSGNTVKSVSKGSSALIVTWSVMQTLPAVEEGFARMRANVCAPGRTRDDSVTNANVPTLFRAV